MNVISLMPVGMVLTVALSGCAFERMEAVWPESRPLGRDLPTYRAPAEPSPSARPPVGELKGVLSLDEVLRAALLQNPELSSTAFEVRAAEAQTLQASSLPNPELELELEDFGGTGEVRGVQASESTFQLSQLVELGGKRARRVRAAGLERDLATWDYEAKRLDVLTEATKAFVDVLAAQEALGLTESAVGLSEQVLNATLERIKAGKVAPVEATRARVEVANARREVERARSARKRRESALRPPGGAHSLRLSGLAARSEPGSPRSLR